MLHPSKLCCTPELLCILMSYTLHPTELACTLLSFTTSFFEIHWTSTLHPLSHAVSHWAALCSIELCYPLLSCVTPHWALLPPAELRFTLLRYPTFTLHLTELRCTLLKFHWFKSLLAPFCFSSKGYHIPFCSMHGLSSCSEQTASEYLFSSSSLQNGYWAVLLHNVAAPNVNVTGCVCYLT
jgi:hypothetical protein